MDATPSDFLAQPDDDSALAPKWIALHAAAEVVASLAGIAADTRPDENFAPTIERAGGWRLTMARQGIDDIAAMMEPGLSALLTLHGQRGDTRAAATALWQEFDRARGALLAIGLAAQDA